MRIDDLVTIALAAGDEIMSIYNTDFDAGEKADGSAITAADEAAEQLILNELAKLYPDTPVLAEECASRGEIPDLGDRFFLVDPLDGTREFVNRTGEFTVNIALIEHGAPVAGVVFAPALGRLWAGRQGDGAFAQAVKGSPFALTGDRHIIRARPCPDEGRVAVASRSHRSPETEALLTHLGAEDFKPAGSSLKFCLVAEGEADVYPRLGRTMEWDTGAGQAVLEAAGGCVHVLDGQTEGGPLRYRKEMRGYDNPHFIAWGQRPETG
ncbi:MAG: 3'(2'),5'-bisphosphate nucleotidase CysQ [Pseudomonadota bacterium]